MTNSSETPRAFVLGLDGIPWWLLERWMDAGELPNFERIRREGATGGLASTRPAITPVAWPSIATGVGPDAHGVYGFMELTSSYSLEVNDRTDLQRPSLWEMVSPSVVANVPMTYPPDEIDGTLVTGMITPSIDHDFTHPPELASRIRDEIPEYDIGLNWMRYRDRPDDLVEDLDTLLTARRELMRMLMADDEWRLFFFVYTAPDRLQHLFWDDEVLLEHYQRLDDIVGEVLDYCVERDANLFVVSDHGFGPISRTVHVNRILEQAGFLTRRDSTRTRSTLTSLGLTKARAENLVRAVGLSPKWLIDLLPSGLVDGVANSIPGDSVLYDIDHGRTKAFIHGPGALYVNDSDRFDAGCVDPSERPVVKRDVRRTLEDATDPASGDRMLEVHDGDDCFPRDDFAPDLVVEPRDGYDMDSRLAAETVSDSGRKAGDHRSEGIFLAWGPDIAAGVGTTDASVFDVAPTVLHAMGEPIPRERDGEPLLEVFGSDALSEPGTVRTASYEQRDRAESERTEDFGEVEERLRGLGYVE